jgi:hypothetical protein
LLIEADFATFLTKVTLEFPELDAPNDKRTFSSPATCPVAGLVS